MQTSRRSSLANPATWYIFAGILLLGASIWVPYLSAVRTARVESRADEISGLLLQATKGQIGAIGPDEVQNVLARFFALAEREQVLVGDLEVHDSPLSGTLLSLQNKHYLFYLAASVPDADAIVSRDSTPSFETMAWPIAGLGPGHSAFFQSDSAPRAYTRNLTVGYQGTADRRPYPSNAQRRTSSLFDVSHSYRDQRDERWIAY